MAKVERDKAHDILNIKEQRKAKFEKTSFLEGAGLSTLLGNTTELVKLPTNKD